MIYREYGTTGKNVSAISFGCMRFNNPEQIERNAELLTYAHAKGINYFDTAPGYCGDKSEDIVGAALAQLEPGTYYVSTKCGQADGDAVRASLERSLQRLGVGKIDFFHIWCVKTPAVWEQRKQGGAVAAAMGARDEGLIDHVVVSTHMGGAEIADMLSEGCFEGVTLGYCALNFPFREEGVAAARAANLGVVTMNPLGGGLIPNHAERFSFLCGPDDPDVVTAALRFNLSHPAITSALVGFSTTDHIDQAVAALDGFEPYPEAHLMRLREHIQEQFDQLCTGCGYCMPCPHGIQIPQLMDAYNHRMLEGSDQSVLNRLKWHWSVSAESAGECVACGKCETACTQSLPIIERLAAIAAINDAG